MDELETELDRVEYLQNMLIARATGTGANDNHYRILRGYFLDRPDTKEILPRFIRVNRDLSEFWQFIKFEFPTYAERREFIWSEFKPLFEFFENGPKIPADESVSEALKCFDEQGVQTIWSRALDRRTSDPEGAITAARTLLETVCKNILDEKGVEYDDTKIELHQLYRLVSTELNLSPSQHTEDVFKQILGGCSAIVNGLGTLRNRLGDAHGKGKKTVRPAARHAELAVNLAGSLALFLVKTWEARKENAAFYVVAFVKFLVYRRTDITGPCGSLGSYTLKLSKRENHWSTSSQTFTRSRAGGVEALDKTCPELPSIRAGSTLWPDTQCCIRPGTRLITPW